MKFDLNKNFFKFNNNKKLDLKKLVNNKLFSDVTFLVEDKPLYAHKNILFARSDVLIAFVTNGMKESNQNEIVINGIKYEVFLALMQFICRTIC